MIYFFSNLLANIERIGKIINISESNCKKLIKNSHKYLFFCNQPVIIRGMIFQKYKIS